MKAPLPANEDERLKALHQYEILDTAPEQEFDDITALASHICGAPIAMLSLLDKDRQWFKSKVGLNTTETSRDDAFCAHGIMQNDVFIVEDALTDARFATNPLVTGDAKVRFYAGAPLTTSDGHNLGMICVKDRVPRHLAPEQKKALQALSRQAVTLLELRRSARELRENVLRLEQTQQELALKTAFLEAQVNSSPDGILVVGQQGRKILQNDRMGNLMKIPRELFDRDDEEGQLRWVAGTVKDPEGFLRKVNHLRSHPHETSHDEVEYKDGRVIDRYSLPVIGKDGKYYGRVWTFRDITERRRSEELLRLLGSAVEQCKEAILITDAEINLPGPRIIFANSAFTKMTGYSAEEALGKTPRILQGPKTERAVLDRLRKNLENGETFEGIAINYRKDGSEFTLEWQLAPIRDPANKITHFVAIQRDITARKQLEAQLFHSQKMETVGKLAGGIAHEFNSILTAIIGQSELILRDVPADSPLAGCATEIHQASTRAATLTRQLLAYGRKQILQLETLDINKILVGMEGVFHHLVGGDVQTRIVLTPGLRTVKADVGQIEHVIVNLVMNARDAMPHGGRLTFETANVSFDKDTVGRYPELKPGDYVMLAITDTGAGMTEEVKARAFEPFFTTKPVGQGTGLGLSTCYGIVKQIGGHISVYSEPGRGATFKVYLPAAEQETASTRRQTPPASLPSGTETILLVEDDPALRHMAATLLRRLGYTVWEAANGVEALSLKQQRNVGHIDLLFTDVVMPHMSGKELADRIKTLYPHTKILFTSAYTENAIAHQGVLDKDVALLQKPFAPAALANKLREVLDQRS